MRQLPPTSPEAKTAALELIATALRLPTLFDFEPLVKIDAVIAAKGHELFALLQIFLNDGLKEFIAWNATHSASLEKFSSYTPIRMRFLPFSRLFHTDLDKTQLERKIRLLTLSSLGFKHVGHDLSYSKVAEALQVEQTEVEKWAIDGTIFLFPSSRIRMLTQPEKHQ